MAKAKLSKKSLRCDHKLVKECVAIEVRIGKFSELVGLDVVDIGELLSSEK